MNPFSVDRRLGARALLPLLACLVVPLALADTPPAVTSDPEIRDVVLGAELVLAPTLTGDAPIASQWFKDGVPIDGATSASYTLPSASSASAGYYTATFTNAAGTSTAAVALVRVGGAAAVPDTSAASYRLMDYFYPRITGAQWLYTGFDTKNMETVETCMVMADLARPVTTYTGRYAPQPIQTTTLAVEGAYGLTVGGSFVATKSWTDYVTAGVSGVAMWGDDYVGGESVRLDGGYSFPGAMRLGQTCEQTGDYYEHGQFVCPVTIFLQLLSVDTVDTPAGRFHGALHLRTVLLAPGNTRIWDEWWVAGLGKVRNKWISGSGLPADSRLVSASRPTGLRYRLADYFVAPIAGSVFTATGKSWNGAVSNTISTITGTNVAITTYTGTGFPGTPGTPVSQQVVADQNVSTATDGTVQESWQEYLTVDGGQITYWGLDNPTEGGSVRFDGGVAFPVDMAVGESTTISRNAYVKGLYVGSGSMKVDLLGVESCTVPAGTFANCLHLQFTVVFALLNQSQSYEMWLAPDVGCVRYRAVAGGGQRERNLVLWAVPRAPVISSQSRRETCTLNGTANLAVLAVGSGPLSFQWYMGESGDVSTPLAGATGYTLTTSALTAWTRYWVRVSNVVGSADSATMLVMPAGGTNTLPDWSLIEDVPNNQRGALNMPAGDQVPNLLKFALGLAPTASVTPGLPRAVIVAGTAGDTNKYLALEFARNAGAQGIALGLEVSADLVKWDEVASSLELLGLAPDGRQNVRLRETVALGTATRRFARLKVATAP